MKKIVPFFLLLSFLFGCGSNNGSGKKTAVNLAEAALRQKYKIHETATTKTLSVELIDWAEIYLTESCFMIKTKHKRNKDDFWEEEEYHYHFYDYSGRKLFSTDDDPFFYQKNSFIGFGDSYRDTSFLFRRDVPNENSNRLDSYLIVRGMHGQVLNTIKGLYGTGPFLDGRATVVLRGNENFIYSYNYVYSDGSVKSVYDCLFKDYGHPDLDWQGNISEGMRKCWDHMEGKYFYEDAEGNCVIEPSFTKAEPFSEGLAAVRESELWGYVNKKGEYVIEPKFHTKPGQFNSGMAKVTRQDGTIAFIDKTGAVVHDAVSSKQRDFFCGYSIASNLYDTFSNYPKEDFFLVDKQFNTVVPTFGKRNAFLFLNYYPEAEIFGFDGRYYAADGEWLISAKNSCLGKYFYDLTDRCYRIYNAQGDVLVKIIEDEF